MTQKIAICAPSHKFVGLYLRNSGVHRQSEKNLINSNISFIYLHNMVNVGPLTAEIDSGVLGCMTARHSVFDSRGGFSFSGSTCPTKRLLRSELLPAGDCQVGHWPIYSSYARFPVLRNKRNSPCYSPCVASPVGNSPRGGPGLSGLVREEARPSISYHT